MVMMDELIQAVSRSAGVSPAQAGQAVGSMLRFLAAHLPSPLFGELQSRLQAQAGSGGAAADPQTDTRP